MRFIVTRTFLTHFSIIICKKICVIDLKKNQKQNTNKRLLKLKKQKQTKRKLLPRRLHTNFLIFLIFSFEKCSNININIYIERDRYRDREIDR